MHCGKTFTPPLRDRLGDFRVKQILRRVDSLNMYTQKIALAIIFAHLRAIMALDHSRLGVENKFLENKSGRIFAFDKFTLQKS